jgi:serine protease Do
MVANGVALAIPSNIVERFVARRGRPARRLGVTVEPVSTPQFGLLIVEVEAGGAAHGAGLQVGDILTGAEGRRFQAPSDLDLALDDEKADRELVISIGDKKYTQKFAHFDDEHHHHHEPDRKSVV